MTLDPDHAEQFQELVKERIKGISPAFAALFLLVAENEGITISELKDLSRIGRCTLTKMLRLLGPAYVGHNGAGKAIKMGFGLIRLQVSLGNRRERVVVLSVKGKKIFKELMAKTSA